MTSDLHCLVAFLYKIAMDTKLSLEELSLEQLEKEVTCGICQEHYIEPKVLPCLHYYCKQCILRLALRTCTGEPLSCPECRSEATLPEGGVDDLKSAFFINRFKSMFYAMERAKGKVEVKCEACTSGAVAKSFCRQCALFICNTCIDTHKTMKTVFEGHEVVSIHDLKKGKARVNLILKEPHTQLKCLVHNEELKVYCFHCDTLICRDCTVVDHRDHRFQFSAVAAPEMKEELVKELEPLRQVGDGLSRVVEEVKSTRHEVEAQGESVAQTINTSFDELLQIVEKRRQELLEEAAKRVQEKVDRLSEQEKNLSLANTEVRSVIEYTDRCVRHCTDNEVMSMHSDIKGRITKKLHQNNKPVNSLEPVVEVDVGIEMRCAEDMQQLCQTKARIIHLPIDPAKCTLRDEGLKTAKLNQITVVTLTAKLSNNKPTRRVADVYGELRSLYNGSVIECDVYQKVDGYRIQYTPTIRGRHELSVTVYGQHVPGSPFPVFVSIHPTQLGKPVRVLDGLRLASAIDVNSSGETIVGQQHINMITIFKEKNKIRTIGRDMLKSDDDQIVAIAVDNENCMYFTLYNSNAITKISENGKIITKARAEHAAGHLGLAVVGDEVMVCPMPSKGTIMVYDRELKYVRRIIGEGMGQFRDMSPDSQGNNLYVTDWERKCIRVFDSYGSFLCSYNCEKNGVMLLTKPRGICVAEQFMYVCNDGLNNNNHSVYVFTTKGEYVSSFGCKGSKLGKFDSPYAVCTDKDGFIYVSDMFRVQVF